MSDSLSSPWLRRFAFGTALVGRRSLSFHATLKRLADA